MKAVLFAGGKGTRLRPLTYFYQKVMIPLGKKQRPLLEYIIRYLMNFDINEFIILVNYKKKQIIDYFEDGSEYGINIEYVTDREGWEGTGSAILNAKDYIEGDDFIVYYGDILTDLNIAKMRDFWKEHNTTGALWLLDNYRLPVGVAEIDIETKRIKEFKEKPPIPQLINSGISMFHKNFFKTIEPLTKNIDVSHMDLSANIMPYLAEKKELVGFVDKAFWLDIGSIERFEKIDPEFLNQVLNRMVNYSFENK